MIQKNQISYNWEKLKEQIPDDFLEKHIVLPVTKTVEIDKIKELIDIGFTRFAENRIELALPKLEALKDYSLTWDFIGNIQSRKINSIVEKFDLIHSVSSFKSANKINNAAEAINKTQKILLQINIAKESQKSGFTVEEVKEQIVELLKLKHLSINGLMAMAPLTTDSNIIKGTFATLKILLEELQPLAGNEFTELSMGMSNDFKIAAQQGSTILRIGSAFFKEII